MTSSAISVVIPTYNRANLLGRALESALAACSPEDEILVVDDGSTDDTPAVVAKFGSRIRFLPQPHGGVGVTRNAGIAAATRPLVGFLDSDDEWDADTLTVRRAFMDARPDVLFSFGNFRVRCGEEVHPRYLINWHNDHRPWSEILGPAIPYSSLAALPGFRADFPVHIGDLYRPLMSTYYIAVITLLVRREAAGAALRFAEDWPVCEDWECSARLAKIGTAAYLDTETATQHGHGGPRLTDANTDVVAQARISVLGRNWGKDQAFLKSHEAAFRQRMAQHHLDRAQWLICQGRTREARQELNAAGRCPASYRLLASLPGFMAKGLLRVRRAVRG